jgi:Flp pilus assembly protein TadD
MAMMPGEQQPIRDDAREFLNTFEPFVRAGNLAGAAECIGRSWCGGKLCAFLKHSTVDIRRAAAMALAMLGDKKAIDPLAAALHDTDIQVHALAEEALWAIWFRAGNNRACCYLKCGMSHLKHGNLDTATEKFNLAIQADPEFAEAYNQRAIAGYLAERYADSIADCRRVLELMPHHFGAMAGMGHCHAQLGNLSEAQSCYRQSLDINPRMDGIIAALAEVRALLGKPAA